MMKLKIETKDDNRTLYWLEADNGLHMSDTFWSPDALLRKIRSMRATTETELREIELRAEQKKEILADYNDATGSLLDIIAAMKEQESAGNRKQIIRDDETFLYTDDGKHWRLPHIVKVEGKPNPHSYHVIGYGPPRAGQYYLSGATLRAYLASKDMDHDYLIIELGKPYRAVRAWEPSE